MKINKAYFGKNKGVNRFGRNGDGSWGVPRMLRLYFQVKHKRHFYDLCLKVAGNSTFGATADKSKRKIPMSGVCGTHKLPTNHLYGKLGGGFPIPKIESVRIGLPAFLLDLEGSVSFKHGLKSLEEHIQQNLKERIENKERLLSGGF